MTRSLFHSFASGSLCRPFRPLLHGAWVIGWAGVCLASAAQALETRAPEKLDASAAVRTQLEGLAAQAGFELQVLGKAPRTTIPNTIEDPGQSEAARLLGDAFDRIEVYAEDGDLEKVVAVARDGDAAKNARRLPNPLAVVAAPRTDPRRVTMSLADALAIANDPSQPLLKRLEAIAALGGSDSAAAVDLLRELGLQNLAQLSEAAVRSLGRFEDTPLADAAQEAMDDIEEHGSVCDSSPVSCLMARADVQKVLDQLKNPNTNSQIARRLIQQGVIQFRGDSDAITLLILTGLESDKHSVRSTAANESARVGVGGTTPEHAALINDALNEVWARDNWGRVQRAAFDALDVRGDPTAFVEPPPPATPPGDSDAGEGNSGDGGGTGRSTDDDDKVVVTFE